MRIQQRPAHVRPIKCVQPPRGRLSVRCLSSQGPHKVRVQMRIPYRCNFGEIMSVVGTNDCFGHWDPANSLDMKWSEGDIWRADVELALDDKQPVKLEYKYVVKGGGGVPSVWKPGGNYVVHVPQDDVRVVSITVHDTWDDSFKKVDVDSAPAEAPVRADQHQHPYEQARARAPQASGTPGAHANRSEHLLPGELDELGSLEDLNPLDLEIVLSKAEAILRNDQAYLEAQKRELDRLGSPLPFPVVATKRGDGKDAKPPIAVPPGARIPPSGSTSALNGVSSPSLIARTPPAGGSTMLRGSSTPLTRPNSAPVGPSGSRVGTSTPAAGTSASRVGGSTPAPGAVPPPVRGSTPPASSAPVGASAPAAGTSTARVSGGTAPLGSAARSAASVPIAGASAPKASASAPEAATAPVASSRGAPSSSTPPPQPAAVHLGRWQAMLDDSVDDEVLEASSSAPRAEPATAAVSVSPAPALSTPPPPSAQPQQLGRWGALLEDEEEADQPTTSASTAPRASSSTPVPGPPAPTPTQQPQQQQRQHSQLGRWGGMLEGDDEEAAPTTLSSATPAQRNVPASASPIAAAPAAAGDDTPPSTPTSYSPPAAAGRWRAKLASEKDESQQQQQDSGSSNGSGSASSSFEEVSSERAPTSAPAPPSSSGSKSQRGRWKGMANDVSDDQQDITRGRNMVDAAFQGGAGMSGTHNSIMSSAEYLSMARRQFNNIEDGYYISPAFLDKLAVHVTKNFTELPKVKVPLILGIWGGKGQGKTFQCMLAFKKLGISPVVMSAGELESGNAGEPAKLVRQRYREASDTIKKGKMCALFINDLDAGAGRMGDTTQYTVNNQMVNATLMNIADSPTNVQLPGVYKEETIPRVPIICTGNDFSTLYAPLIRDGRMDKFYWNPTREDRIGVCMGIFQEDGVSRGEVEQLVDLFPGQSIDFFGALRARVYDNKVREFIQSIGVENMGKRLINSKEGKVSFEKPQMNLEALIMYGNLLTEEQENVKRVQLATAYMSGAELAGNSGSSLPEEYANA